MCNIFVREYIDAACKYYKSTCIQLKRIYDIHFSLRLQSQQN